MNLRITASRTIVAIVVLAMALVVRVPDGMAEKEKGRAGTREKKMVTEKERE